jgi:lipoate-protein ligase A
MELDLLPTRHAGAAENMAVDFLLLRRYPEPSHARLRAYGWHRPAFTFGYSQKIAEVRAFLPAEEGPFDLCRRPTGGGLVDHRDDWTYALVIPRAHPVHDLRAVESYRAVHGALAEALCGMGCAAVLKTHCEPDTGCVGSPGVCFPRAELYDVVRADTGGKLAGAAQKRTKDGLLFQGSVSRAAVGGIDGDALLERFAAGLAALLHADLTPTGWPEFSEDEVMALTEQYASSEWNEHR